MENRGILVYCIVNQFDNRISGINGMDEEGKLYAIEQSGLYAIVSDVKLSEYGEEAMNDKAEDIDWLQEKAVLFMDIILKVNSLANVIPMKFLTIFTTMERVKSIITENYDQFIHNHEKIKDRDELSIKIYCDDKIYKEKVMGEEISTFEKSLAGKPKGAAFFLRKKFDGELDDRIQSRICDLANEFTDKISTMAVDRKINKILAKEITGIAIPMILNCAYLVDSNQRQEFSDRITKLKEDYEENGFLIELTGPWPPFSFCE